MISSTSAFDGAIMKSTIPDYCSDNTLLIPESLFQMADATPVMAHGNAAIFHKLIRKDMRDIEFFTNAPCLAFVLRGRETFSSPDHEEFVLLDGEMLFMPRELYMVSDFTSQEGPLEAFLFFFDEAVVTNFLRCSTLACANSRFDYHPYKLATSKPVSFYMASLKTVYQNLSGTPDLLRTKLLELLLLIETLEGGEWLRGFLTKENTARKRRNIKHLMRDHQAYNLTVKDFATLSGRSLSSFNRDFKRQFGTTPIQWLIDVRLKKAHEMMLTSDLSVTQVAASVGYNNTSHFIKTFKSKYAITPKQVRQQLA